jgi:hypothetical protein
VYEHVFGFGRIAVKLLHHSIEHRSRVVRYFLMLSIGTRYTDKQEANDQGLFHRKEMYYKGKKL